MPLPRTLTIPAAELKAALDYIERAKSLGTIPEAYNPKVRVLFPDNPQGSKARKRRARTGHLWRP